MDLLSDLKAILVQHLTTLGTHFKATDSAEQLLLLVLNHELKTVAPRPRTVHCSRKFQAKLSKLPVAQQQAANAIMLKFGKGDDINGHLSTGSARPKETDPLLADWRIHHLHISNHKKKPSDKFYARTGPVMFAQISDDAVYFIDIYPHGKGFPETWTRQEVLKIVDDEWPHLLDPYRATGIVDVAFTPSDMELKKLRKARVNTILKVGGSFVTPPGGGLTGAGTPVANMLRKNRTIQVIKELEARVAARSTEL